MDEVERTRLLQEAEDIERQEKLAMDKADFEAEKRRKAMRMPQRPLLRKQPD